MSVCDASWPCPQCQVPVVPRYTVTMVRFTDTIPMYCARCDTEWTLTADQRSRLLSDLEERAAG
jgi:hypothetical protein